MSTNKQAKSASVSYLNVGLNDNAMKYLEAWLGEEFPDAYKPVTALEALMARAEKVVFSKYEAQIQVTGYFLPEGGRDLVGVSAKGVKADLAILCLYAKCEYVLLWNFGESNAPNSPVTLPRFS